MASRSSTSDFSERTSAQGSRALARRAPTRSCVACRTSREKRELLRVVRTPEGVIRADPTGRTSGRGAYVCRDRACITTAIDRGVLSKALESPVPAGLADELAAAVMTEIIGGGARGQE